MRHFTWDRTARLTILVDPRLTGLRRLLLKAAGGWRYALQWYEAPYELQALHRLLRYQRPETTGF